MVVVRQCSTFKSSQRSGTDQSEVQILNELGQSVDRSLTYVHTWIGRTKSSVQYVPFKIVHIPMHDVQSRHSQDILTCDVLMTSHSLTHSHF